MSLTSSRGEPIRVTVSAGVVSFEDADPGAHAAIRTVETALDEARSDGPDSIVAA